LVYYIPRVQKLAEIVEPEYVKHIVHAAVFEESVQSIIIHALEAAMKKTILRTGENVSESPPESE
jgi:hypothetical protein